MNNTDTIETIEIVPMYDRQRNKFLLEVDNYILNELRSGLKLLYINRTNSRKKADKNRKNIKPRVFYEVAIGEPVEYDEESYDETASNYAQPSILPQIRAPIPYLPQQRFGPIPGYY